MKAQMDPQITEFLELIDSFGLPPISTMPLEELRSGGRRAGGPPPSWWGIIESVKQITVAGAAGKLPARVYRPRLPADGPLPPLVVFFHGGGWATGNIDTHDGEARMIAAEAGAIVVSVDYRLAPEHPFPAAADDAISATAWLRENAAALGADPKRVAVAGDSAGGNLAAVAAQSDAGRGLAAQLLIYPSVSGGSHDFPSVEENASAPFLDMASFDRFLGYYQGESADVRFAPLRAHSLSRQAPAVVGVAGFDPLRDEGIAYARRLEEEGVYVVLRRYDDLVHAFFSLAPLSASAEQAARGLCRDLGKLLRPHSLNHLLPFARGS
ncbi:acetyl esterase [Arthrobacter ulcerisalmonis]|nr:alpha/beta hydrolase [Arthrobacter ulcerisalmonis]MDQ0664660.1 acetyl esterase [Arthrobacter ulcerisalmonis]